MLLLAMVTVPDLLDIPPPEFFEMVLLVMVRSVVYSTPAALTTFTAITSPPAI